MKQERAVRTRRELIRAAAREFRSQGFAQTKLHEVCRNAGVSTGALHFHFDNKAAVASAVEAAAEASLYGAAQAAQRDQEFALQALVDTSHAVAALLRDDVVTLAGYRLTCDITRTSELDLRHDWHRCVQRLLARAADEDTLAADVLEQGMAATIMAATTGLEELARRNEEWLSRYSLTGVWQNLLPRLAPVEVLRKLEPAGSPAAFAHWPRTG